MGVRMALGAAPGDVQWMVLAEGLRITELGILGGLLLSVAAVNLLRGFLFGLSPFDPVAFATAGMAWLIVAMRSEEHTSELQSLTNLVCRLLLEKTSWCFPGSTWPGPSGGACAARTRHRRDRPARGLDRRAPRRAGGGEKQLLSGLLFFNDTAPTEIYTLSLHDALPI